eukprot:1899393-Rhodomonas_salina.1
MRTANLHDPKQHIPTPLTMRPQHRVGRCGSGSGWGRWGRRGGRRARRSRCKRTAAACATTECALAVSPPRNHSLSPALFCAASARRARACL